MTLNRYSTQLNSKNNANFMIQYVKGETLTNFLAKNTEGIKESNAAKIMNQLLSAINHCHANNIAHRDIKPDNIMIDSKFNATLIDFGSSKVFSKEKQMKEKVGSPLFMAPEIGHEKYDNKWDIWSLGIVMYILLSGRLPFYGESPKEVLKQAQECDLALNSEFWKNTSAEAKDLMKMMITVDPIDRPTCAKILNHEWFDCIKEESTDDSAELSDDHPVLELLQTYKPQSKLTHFILTTLNKMTSSKHKHLYREFKKYDENQDGLISAVELKNALNMWNIDATPEQVGEIINKMDLSGNNSINFSEFLSATNLNRSFKSNSYIRILFDQIDVDWDGIVSKEDLSDAFKLRGFKLSKSDIKQIFLVHDSKNRGYLTLHDFEDTIMNL